MILIISDANDVHTQKVESYLFVENVKFIRFNLDVNSLLHTFVTYDENDWQISCPNGSFKCSEISVVWNRRTYVELLLDEMDSDNVGFKIWKGEWNKTLLGIYSSLESKKWLNYYRDSYYAENKYKQYSIAKAIGFNTPSFICSNDKSFISNFLNDETRKVLKFMNQDFYKTGKSDYKGIYVNLLSSEGLSKFQEFGENPIVVQDYINKKYEVRYTIVGTMHFVCKIESQSSVIANIDWRRYDLANTPHSIIEPPLCICEKVNQFMNEFNLNYGAMDFIIDENDNWFFLELNSMGQFLWIEDLTGLDISYHISRWLIINSQNFEV